MSCLFPGNNHTIRAGIFDDSVLLMMKSIILEEDYYYLLKGAVYQTLQSLHPVNSFGTFLWKMTNIQKVLKRVSRA